MGTDPYIVIMSLRTDSTENTVISAKPIIQLLVKL